MRDTAIFACTTYDFVLPYWTKFNGEQFATEIECRCEDNPRTRAIIESVKRLVAMIYRTPAGVKFSIKKQTDL